MSSAIGRVGQVIGYIARHPMNRGRELRSIARFVGWQLYKRVVRKPVTIQYVAGSRLKIYPDNYAASGVLYTGLPEYDDMMFVMRYLRRDDTFVDIGANIGMYTILAAAVAPAGRVLAFEPHHATHARLLENVRLNAFSTRVDARRCALSKQAGRLRFTSNLDAVNHFAEGQEAGVEVDVETLDVAASGLKEVALVKMDVEGAEHQVLEGARDFLKRVRPLVWIIELNGSGRRYGSSDAAIVGLMDSHGYAAFRYSAQSGTLTPYSTSMGPINGIFTCDLNEVSRRLQAPRSVER